MGSLRIFVTDGPGDAIESFRYWRRGQDNPGVTHVPFSSQTYEACATHGAEVMVIGSCARIDSLRDGRFWIRHLGDPTHGKRGLAYHIAELRRGLVTVAEIVRFRADVAVLGLHPHPFLMHLLRPFGVKVILNIHNVLWCQFGPPPRRSQQIIHWLNASFYKNGCFAITCVSAAIKRQIRSLRPGRELPFVDFLPWFRSVTFENITEPLPEQRPLRVMFAGRIEQNKGVFDLLSIACSLQLRGRSDIVFEVCGDGSALADLRIAVANSDAASCFELLGHCSRAQMREAFARSHVVIVPTRSDFGEGFNMVVVEALLARRPVITSRVCPAVEYLGGGVVEVEPDDWRAYESALVSLADDPNRYRSLQQEARRFGERFLIESTSWQAALSYLLDQAAEAKRAQPREIEPLPAGHPQSSSSG